MTCSTRMGGTVRGYGRARIVAMGNAVNAAATSGQRAEFGRFVGSVLGGLADERGRCRDVAMPAYAARR